MTISRRCLFVGAASCAVAASLPEVIPAVAATSVRLRWQTWPFGMERPDLWSSGSGPMQFFFDNIVGSYEGRPLYCAVDRTGSEEERFVVNMEWSEV